MGTTDHDNDWDQEGLWDAEQQTFDLHGNDYISPEDHDHIDQCRQAVRDAVSDFLQFGTFADLLETIAEVV